MQKAIIIDDEAKGRLALRQKLADYCPQIKVIAEADNGQEGILLIEHHKPDVIFLDIEMPRMNGFEFLQEIRSDNELMDSVVFVLTTSDADSDKIRAYYENIAGYMVKSAVGPQFLKLAKLLDSYHESVNLP